MMFNPVTSGRMSTQIVGQIQAAIDAGDLKLGDRLPSERDLADIFGVSRVTVRDALRALEAIGLVDIRLGASGGAFISVPEPHLIGQGLRNVLQMSAISPIAIAEARLAVELSTVAMVVERHTAADLSELEEDCERQEAELRAGKTTVGSRFHVLLARASKNEALLVITKTFRGPLSMSSIRPTSPGSAESRQTIQAHRTLIECIRDGDARRAQGVMAVHLLRGLATEGEARQLASTIGKL